MNHLILSKSIFIFFFISLCNIVRSVNTDKQIEHVHNLVRTLTSSLYQTPIKSKTKVKVT